MQTTTPTTRRRLALLGAGIRGADLARECGCSASWVSKVISAKVLMGPGARRVMNAMANRLGRSVDDLWPELKRVV